MVAVIREPTENVYQAPERVRAHSLIPEYDDYLRMYRESLDDSDAFWARMAREHLTWAHDFREV